MQGGIPCGSLTELVGESGSGKTQLCLQLLLEAAKRPGGGALYIYTEGYFPSRRLQQLADRFRKPCGRLGKEAGRKKQCSDGGWRKNGYGDGSSKAKSDGGLIGYDQEEQYGYGDGSLKACSDGALMSKQEESGYGGEEARDPCDQIFVENIPSIDELLEFFRQRAPLLLRRSPIKLIVIDSVAALFRSDFDNTAHDLACRTSCFFRLSSTLKILARQFDLAVLLTNQVVDYIPPDVLPNSNSLHGMLSASFPPLLSSCRQVVPALGLSWTHCVNTRLFLSRTLQLHHHEPSPISMKTAVVQAQETAEIDEWHSTNLANSHSSVLERLESELPDDLLIRFSHQKSTPSPNLPLLKQHLDSRKINSQGHSKIPDSIADFESPATTRLRRTMQTVFAPHLPPSCCEFVVEADQVRGYEKT